MRKEIGYKHGYRITISNGFYEVIDGRRVVYFGQCKKRVTIQEIANKTILSQEDSNVSYRRKRNGKVIRKEISGRSQRRCEAYAAKDVISL